MAAWQYKTVRQPPAGICINEILQSPFQGAAEIPHEASRCIQQHRSHQLGLPAVLKPGVVVLGILVLEQRPQWASVAGAILPFDLTPISVEMPVKGSNLTRWRRGICWSSCVTAPGAGVGAERNHLHQRWWWLLDCRRWHWPRWRRRWWLLDFPRWHWPRWRRRWWLLDCRRWRWLLLGRRGCRLGPRTRRPSTLRLEMSHPFRNTCHRDQLQLRDALAQPAVLICDSVEVRLQFHHSSPKKCCPIFRLRGNLVQQKIDPIKPGLATQHAPIGC